MRCNFLAIVQLHAKSPSTFIGGKTFDASQFSIVGCIASAESLKTHEVVKLESDHCNVEMWFLSDDSYTGIEMTDEKVFEIC